MYSVLDSHNLFDFIQILVSFSGLYRLKERWPFHLVGTHLRQYFDLGDTTADNFGLGVELLDKF
jgi:hypothetical protein